MIVCLGTSWSFKKFELLPRRTSRLRVLLPRFGLTFRGFTYLDLIYSINSACQCAQIIGLRINGLIYNIQALFRYKLVAAPNILQPLSAILFFVINKLEIYTSVCSRNSQFCLFHMDFLAQLASRPQPQPRKFSHFVQKEGYHFWNRWNNIAGRT